jgi:sorbitol/mannitol transport system substrate-binding protein
VREGLSVKGTLYALPFYAESSITYYRTDLFKDAGLTMPERPTWDPDRRVRGASSPTRTKEQYGICLRGKAGWGENMALITTVANAYGARWFDEQWQAGVHRSRVEERAELLRRHHEEIRPAGCFQQRVQRKPGPVQQRQVRDLGRRQRRRLLRHRQDPEQGQPSTSASPMRPIETTDKGSAWLYSWALAIPTSSKAKDAAKDLQCLGHFQGVRRTLVAEDRRHRQRAARHPRLDLQRGLSCSAAPFARVTLESLKAADPGKPSAETGAVHRHSTGDHS